MRLTTYDATPASRRAAAATVQFGDQLLHLADDDDAMPAAGLVARATSAPIARERLHLVVQKGRPF